MESERQVPLMGPASSEDMENCESESGPENAYTKAGITTIPNELFEMIVGAIAFVDLPYFLQASNQFNVYLFQPIQS